jgi:hypothetical protein
MIWLSIATIEKIRLALNVSNRSKDYFETIERWLVNNTEDEPLLCWRPDLTEGQTDAYSGFIMPDKHILKTIFKFIERRGANIHYISDEPYSKACDYNIFVSNGQLQLVSTSP